jgi:tRNA A-37 threonylcarbamoyl transferase component Bud32
VERRVHEVSWRFEAAWKAAPAGPGPCIGDYINDIPGPERLALLRELLCLDVEYRRLAGEQPAPEDYLGQFPDQAELIHAALSQPPPVIPGLQVATGSAPGAAGAVQGPLPCVPGYEVLGELGRGGMGVVYKARQTKLNRVVALKMILAGAHAGAADLARFRTEAEAVARLQHSHIIQIHEMGEHDGLPYFSLEFCAGGSLDRKLAGTPLPPKQAAALVEQLARAVQAAHDKGIVHRDLKPANILLAEDGTPKITDFGLARKLGEAGQTASGAVMGTPSYMAPEQAAGKSKEAGPRADVYALGAILYACLTGRPPFQAATLVETVLQVIEGLPASPRDLNKAVDRRLEFICLKCLRKNPDHRYRSAKELAADLERWRKGKPIEPEGPLEWLWRQFQAPCRLDRPREWVPVFGYLAVWRVICHLVMARLLQLGPVPAAFWAWFICLHVGTWLPVWWLRHSKTRLDPIERGLLLNWGATFACDALLFALFCPPWGQARPEEVVRVYSAWPAAHGLWYVMEGRRFWGRFYAVGIGYFVAAPLLSLCGLLAPVAYALVVGCAMLLLGDGFRHLAKQQAADRLAAHKAAAGALPPSSGDRL